MSGFAAINVEPEDNLEEDVDDTREIQLEEAFKLYQNALKLHSQGPQYFQEAKDAYDELLRSEVFKYPEVVSEFAQDELNEEGTVVAAQADTTALPLLPSDAAESSASSIPQFLYLAFKNKGQFLLDAARHRLSNPGVPRAELCRSYAQPAKESLQQFAQALERDDTDLDLWKKAARVADVLSSHRIARFCMESVLAGEDEDGQQTIDISGLEEAYADGELREIVTLLQDDLTQSQRQGPRVKDHLLTRLKKSLDPYPTLPMRAKILDYVDDKYRPLSFAIAHEDLRPASTDIYSLGEKIADVINTIQNGHSSLSTGTIVKVVLPEPTSRDQDIVMTSRTKDAGNDPQNGTLRDLMQSPTQSRTQAESATENSTARDEDGATHSLLGQKDAEKMVLSGDGDTIEVRSAAPVPDDPNSMASRKRSSTMAGNEEPEGRTKSKRLRARESMADLAAQEEEISNEHPQYSLEQLAFYEQTDQVMFDVVNTLMSRVGIPSYPSAEKSRQAFWTTTEDAVPEVDSGMSKKDVQLLADLRQLLSKWTDGQGASDSARPQQPRLP